MADLYIVWSVTSMIHHMGSAPPSARQGNRRSIQMEAGGAISLHLFTMKGESAPPTSAQALLQAELRLDVAVLHLSSLSRRKEMPQKHNADR